MPLIFCQSIGWARLLSNLFFLLGSALMLGPMQAVFIHGFMGDLTVISTVEPGTAGQGLMIELTLMMAMFGISAALLFDLARMINPSSGRVPIGLVAILACLASCYTPVMAIHFMYTLNPLPLALWVLPSVTLGVAVMLSHWILASRC